MTPRAGRRVVDEALRMTHQPLLDEVGSELTDAQVFAVPNLQRLGCS